MTDETEILFQFELPNELVLAIQQYIRVNVPYSEMNHQDGFKFFVQNLVIRFIASFQPTDILLKTANGQNPNYGMFRMALAEDEVSLIIRKIGKGRYFDIEVKKKLFEVWNSYSKLNELGLLNPIS